MTDDVRIFPVWKEAAQKIADRVASEGYGFLISWDEIRSMLEIKDRVVGMTPEQMDAIEFDKLEKTVNLANTLLMDHNICINNIRNRGYEVLHPNKQVTQGFDRKWSGVRKELRSAMNILAHVEHELLDSDSRSALDRNMNKTVFVLSAANKRQLPKIENKKIA